MSSKPIASCKIIGMPFRDACQTVPKLPEILDGEGTNLPTMLSGEHESGASPKPR